jgi:hypothetical protein
MGFQSVEYQFPDEKKVEVKDENPKAKASESEEIEVEIVDDTPEEDRGRQPAPPPDEVTDDELTKYSEDVQKRIKKFTRGYHDERRAKEAALREKEEAVKLAQAVLAENERLKGTVNTNQQALLENAKKVAQTEVETARRKYKDAYESGDADALVDAQEALTTAKLKAERLANFKPPALQPKENAVQPQQTAPQPATADQKAVAWREQNEWFGSDEEMTAFALGLHKKLIGQGVDPRGDDYYEKINSRMRQVFPDQFDEESKPEGSPKPKAKTVVAPATRSTAPKKIVLTQTQVSLAKRLGVPLDVYAKQVAEEMRKQNG